jgi:hypothetical protein
LDIEDFKASDFCIDGFKWQHNVVYKTMLGECTSRLFNSGGMGKGIKKGKAVPLTGCGGP